MKNRSVGLLACACCLLTGCGAVECCFDHAVSGVVSGTVVDADGEPQAAVDLAAIDLRRDCSGLAETGAFMSGRSDAEGRFVLAAYLPLRAEGRYCFDMVLTMGSVVDTTEQLEMSMELRSPSCRYDGAHVGGGVVT
jgi:hypothetical protein